MRQIEDLPQLVMPPDMRFEYSVAPILEEARRHEAVRSLFGVTFLRRESCQTVLRDRRVEARISASLDALGVTEGQLYDSLQTSILNLNGPPHARLRGLLNKAFTLSRVERLRPTMRALTVELVDRFRPAGRCEFMEDFANHYPVQVVCTLLGVPREDHDHFRSWLDTISFGLSLLAGQKRAEIEQAQRDLDGYVRAMVEARRSTPADDLITALLEVEESGDALTFDEIVAMTGGLLFAGHDTTRNQLGLAMATFCEHPDQWKLLGERPELAAQAVDEVMRMNPSVGGVAPRFIAEDMAIGDVALPKGTIVGASTVAANRDPVAFEDPDVFDITKVRTTPNLTFGGGPHLCLGINLAKAEMQEALVVLAGALRDLSLDGEPEYPPRVGIFGPTRLPLRFTPAS